MLSLLILSLVGSLEGEIITNLPNFKNRMRLSYSLSRPGDFVSYAETLGKPEFDDLRNKADRLVEAIEKGIKQNEFSQSQLRTLFFIVADPKAPGVEIASVGLRSSQATESHFIQLSTLRPLDESLLGDLLHEGGHTHFMRLAQFGGPEFYENSAHAFFRGQRQSADYLLREVPALYTEMGGPSLDLAVLKNRYAEAWQRVSQYLPGFEALDNFQKISVLVEATKDERLLRDIPAEERKAMVTRNATIDGSKKGRRTLDDLERLIKGTGPTAPKSPLHSIIDLCLRAKRNSRNLSR